MQLITRKRPLIRHTALIKHLSFVSLIPRMRKTILQIVALLFCSIQLDAQLIQNTLIIKDTSDSYVSNYILKQEAGMVEPIPMLNGRMEDFRVTNSRGLLTTIKYNENNPVVNIQPTKTSQQQIQEIEAESNYGNVNIRTKEGEKAYYNSPQFADKTKSYTDALRDLKDMLKGKQSLSLSKAYYELENAYGNTYLPYEDFNNEINKSANFIRSWMKEHRLNSNDNEKLNYAIQKFMSDTLSIILKYADNKQPPQKITHLPFHYDYVDFEGEQDYRNYFATKCIATGYGQCNSMPATYLCLAEALGAKAYLSFAPKHSLIKYPDNGGYLHNYEVTANYYIPDKWYQDNLFIKPQAIYSGIFLDTLNKKQVVANCMVDLAIGYLEKFGAADGQFILDCLKSSEAEFPDHNNIFEYFTYSSTLIRFLGRELYYDQTKDLSDTLKNPNAKYYYDALQSNEKLITKLGYQDIPEKRYMQMMKIDSTKATNQKGEGINSKQRRTLFIIK
jgi:hypothetical protein